MIRNAAITVLVVGLCALAAAEVEDIPTFCSRTSRARSKSRRRVSWAPCFSRASSPLLASSNSSLRYPDSRQKMTPAWASVRATRSSTTCWMAFCIGMVCKWRRPPRV